MVPAHRGGASLALRPRRAPAAGLPARRRRLEGRADRPLRPRALRSRHPHQRSDDHPVAGAPGRSGTPRQDLPAQRDGVPRRLRQAAQLRRLSRGRRPVPAAPGAAGSRRSGGGAASLLPAGGGEGALLVPLGGSRRPPSHARGARRGRSPPVATRPGRARRRGAHRGVLRGRGRRHRHAVRRRRGAARLPASAAPRGPRLLVRSVPPERARPSGHAGRCAQVRACSRLHWRAHDGVPPESHHRRLAVSRFQRPLLGGAAAHRRLGSRLSVLALSGARRGQARLPASVPLGHRVPELAARSPVGAREPGPAACRAYPAARDCRRGVAIRHAARVERHAGRRRSRPGAGRICRASRHAAGGS